MFRDLLVDHRPLTTHVSKAKRAVSKVYRAVGTRNWTTVQAEILVALAELQRAYEYLETEIAEVDTPHPL